MSHCCCLRNCLRNSYGDIAVQRTPHHNSRVKYPRVVRLRAAEAGTPWPELASPDRVRRTRAREPRMAAGEQAPDGGPRTRTGRAHPGRGPGGRTRRANPGRRPGGRTRRRPGLTWGADPWVDREGVGGGRTPGARTHGHGSGGRARAVSGRVSSGRRRVARRGTGCTRKALVVPASRPCPGRPQRSCS
jgi:hypothetical protein